jgi:hypothetical protein
MQETIELYRISAKEILIRGLLVESDIYYYKKEYKGSLYDEYYKWCMSHIEHNDKVSKLQTKPFVVFINDYSRNAFASSGKDYKLIGINLGLVESMYDFYLEREPILESEEFSGYRNLTMQLYKQPVTYFLFKYFTKFTFFHELGHLFQTSTIKEIHQEFNSTVSSDESIISQYRECDADCFAAWHICVQIKADFDTLPISFRTKDNLLRLASLANTAMYVYFVQTSGEIEGIYFTGKTHPHPLVRNGYFSKAILNGLNSLNFEFKITEDLIYPETFKLTNSLFGLSMHELLNLINPIFDDLIKYIEFLEASIGRENSAIYNYFDEIIRK